MVRALVKVALSTMAKNHEKGLQYQKVDIDEKTV